MHDDASKVVDLDQIALQIVAPRRIVRLQQRGDLSCDSKRRLDLGAEEALPNSHSVNQPVGVVKALRQSGNNPTSCDLQRLREPLVQGPTAG
jgi:hypothetical protein